MSKKYVAIGTQETITVLEPHTSVQITFFDFREIVCVTTKIATVVMF